jgi:hypothetical protein
VCLEDLGKNAELDEINRHMAREHGGFAIKLDEDGEPDHLSDNDTKMNYFHHPVHH